MILLCHLTLLQKTYTAVFLTELCTYILKMSKIVELCIILWYSIQNRIPWNQEGELMRVWIEDADAIEMNDRSLKIIYLNERVESFVFSKKMLGVSGIKGQGKTFLLKVKRNLAEKEESVTCFPKNYMVDQLDSSIVINNSINKYMEDYTKWVSLWKIAIAITIIQNKDIGIDIKKIENKMPEGVKILLNKSNNNFRPSVYLNELLTMDRDVLNQTISYTTNLLDLLQEIHHAVYVFIDKIDQAFSIDIHRIWGDSKMSRGPRNASYWQYCQYALANAAYDLYSNINPHIKVYYSIRQEALIDTCDIAPNLKRNIESYIINLEYDKEDLRDMFKVYVTNEDNDKLNTYQLKESNPVRAFLGTDIIENKYVSKNEDAFDYIYRHSLKRPSDIMKICKDLSYDNKKGEILLIRNIVNGCATGLLNMYIRELKPFLPYQINDFYIHINTNILNQNYLRYICNRYINNKVGAFKCSRNCTNCLNMHPFTVLYNLGLLGYVKEDIHNGRLIQSFNRAGNSIFLEKFFQIPKSDYYFIHPCLMDVIRERRTECGLTHFTDKNYIVGDCYEFSYDKTKEIDMKIKEAENALKKEEVFISSTIEDLQSERDVVKNALIYRGYNPVMSEKNNFPLNAEKMNKVHSHDYCIDRLLECGGLIFIIGSEYGGKYAGTKYKKYKQEIIQASNNQITAPSISLMEFYIAVKRKLFHYAFIAKQFDRAEDRERNWSDDVIKEYNFINHLKINDNINGNWISRYEDLDDLSIRVKQLVFKS